MLEFGMAIEENIALLFDRTSVSEISTKIHDIKQNNASLLHHGLRLRKRKHEHII